MKIPENLFDLTTEQEASSKSIYSGKVIKCLVAPYHSFSQLEKEIPFSKSTYLFPEREMTIPQIRGFISLLVKSKHDEIRIITVNQNIIIDMIDGCVRILTQKNTIVDCPEKTFMANIHTIRYCILENESHQNSKEEQNIAAVRINELIDKINKTKKFTKAEYNAIANEVDQIGEELISYKLKEMASDKTER